MATPRVFTNKLNKPVYLRIFEDGIQVTQESIGALASYTHIPSHEHAKVVFKTPESINDGDALPEMPHIPFQTNPPLPGPLPPPTDPKIPDVDPNAANPGGGEPPEIPIVNPKQQTKDLPL